MILWQAENLHAGKSFEPGPVYINHSQEYSLSFSPSFENLNATQLPIG